MMQSSEFSNNQLRLEELEQVNTQGATCDTFRVKLYGKLHFLKRLKAEHAHDIRYQEALRKEFETGYSLEHPNLVRYISQTEDSILMEYVDGETLAQRLTCHPDYFRKRKNREKFVSQLLDVIDYLHSHQILHLDLKPDNILFTRINDDVKLIDLGFCYTDSYVDTQGFTEGFAAPEQVNGNQADARTDIYAIGKILGLLPDHHIYNKVIARCTAENPEDRYQSVEELRRAVVKHTSWRLIVFVLLSWAFFAWYLTYMLFSSQEHQSSQPVVLADTLSAMSVDTPAIVAGQQPKNIPATIVPATSSRKPSDISQLKADIAKVVKPRFDATLGVLPDSVRPGSKQWAEAGWALERTLDESNTLKDLILSYPDIPMEKVSEEYNAYIQSLITLKYNQAKKQYGE